MRVTQVAQHAADLQRATAFYTSLLGAAPTRVFDPPGLVFFDLEGIRLLLDREAPSALIYLEVPDVPAALSRLGDAVEVVGPAHVIFHHDDGALGPEGLDEWQAFVRDSEGNTVGLVAFRRP